MIQTPYLIIDGLNYFTRFFCVVEAVSSTGDLVGGVVGFVKGLGSLIDNFKPGKVIVVWEQGGPSQRRKHIYSEYKANRATNKSLNQMYRNDGKFIPSSDGKNKVYQLQLLTKALGHLPVCQIYVPDTEADDIIAYLAKRKFQTVPNTKIIVSSDKDFYQLLEDDNIRIYDPGKKILIDSNYVLEKFEISCRNITLARSIVGDDSDNLDGVPGVGLKTVAHRFPDFKRNDVDLDISWLQEESGKLLTENKKPPKCFEDIIRHVDIVKRNWSLMYLDTSCLASNQISKIDYRLENFVPACNRLDYIKTFMAADIPMTYDLDHAFSYAKSLIR